MPQTQPISLIPRGMVKALFFLQVGIVVAFITDLLMTGNKPIEEWGGGEATGIFLMGAGVLVALFTFFYEIFILIKYKERGTYYLLSLFNWILSLSILFMFVTQG